jgi:Amt family ammonium transporter
VSLTSCFACAAVCLAAPQDVLFGRKMRATGACIGAVIGLVCVTPAAGFINIGAAFIFGVVGAVVCSSVLEGMERWGSRYVDDTLGE